MQKPSKELAAGIVNTLLAIFNRGINADKALSFTLRLNPKWHAGVRGYVAESVYDIIRHWRHLWMLAELPPDEYLTQVTEQRVWWIWAASRMEAGFSIAPFPEMKGLPKSQIYTQLEQRLPNTRYAFPDWLNDACKAELKERWPRFMEELDRPASQHIRVNTLKTNRHTLLQGFHADDIAAFAPKDAPDAVILRYYFPLHELESFDEGMFEIQDAGSQQIAPFLQAEPGMRVLDACAGAGGKSLHLAALMRNKGRIVAFDVDEKKLKELRKRASRAGADTIEIRSLEGPKTLKRYAGTMDRVLCDVPCSGLGALRRNPGIRWKLKPEDLANLRQLQQSILSDFSPLVKSGGKLVYATCSILPSENEKQVRAFLKDNHNHWKLEEEMVLQPGINDADGFYAARLVRV